VINNPKNGRFERGRDRPRGGMQVLWSFIDVLGSKIIVLVTFVVLASYLDPHEFGMVAIATAIIGALIATMDASFGGALIQREKVDASYFDTGFTLSLLAGVVFAVLLVIAGLVIKSLSGAAAYFNAFVALAPVILLSCLTVAHQSYLVRSNQLGILAKARLLSIVVGCGCAVAWAVMDASYWVLLIQQITTSVTFTVAVWATSSWYPRIGFNRAAAKDLFRFTKYFWMWGGVNALEKNIDLWIIGAVVGPVAVGFYTTAQRLGAIIYEVTTGPIIRLILPSYSRLQNNHAALRERIIAVNAVTTIATLPVFVGFAYLSADVVTLLLDPKWQPVAELLPLFVASMFFYSSYMYDNQLLTATDRPGTVLKLASIGVTLLAVAIGCGIAFGLVGVAVAILVRNIVVKVLVFRAVQQQVGIRTMPYLSSMIPAVVSTSVMLLGLVVLDGSKAIPNNLYMHLAATFVCGVLLYIGCVLLCFRTTILEIRRVLLPGYSDPEIGAVDVLTRA
jgi:O-antigen/teichoic acid export membrane protein